ncbi:unnamed protein product [Paramecium sonneborni]|uniref:Uncharacterized protein n=1 Tax=Paramecium sonneborni TaxID=65129 RepID=A0A8S1R7W6_9CILI|nr:unnamed protein product [Paramecium sonneborni]
MFLLISKLNVKQNFFFLQNAQIILQQFLYQIYCYILIKLEKNSEKVIQKTILKIKDADVTLIISKYIVKFQIASQEALYITLIIKQFRNPFIQDAQQIIIKKVKFLQQKFNKSIRKN